MSESGETLSTLRLDKWLFYARFFKSRSLAARLCEAGKIRVNHIRVSKAHHALKIGDVLTFPQGDRIRVVRVQALPVRRTPGAEVTQLYENLDLSYSAGLRKSG